PIVPPVVGEADQKLPVMIGAGRRRDLVSPAPDPALVAAVPARNKRRVGISAFVAPIKIEGDLVGMVDGNSAGAGLGMVVIRLRSSPTDHFIYALVNVAVEQPTILLPMNVASKESKAHDLFSAFGRWRA